jgi:predicted ATPase
MTAIVETSRPRAGEASPLIGRHEELVWLDQALARVRRGDPAVVLIGGDVGVGKSRLVREFSASVAATAHVLTGKCPELGAIGLPFAPFTDVLTELTSGPAGSPVPLGDELLRLLPGQPPPGPAADPKADRARLFVQMLSLLERLAGPRPVVLVIEDAHWADESTRDLITFLVDNQGAMDGVLIVVTYRSDELHRGHPFNAMLSGLGRLGWVLRRELSGLSRSESAAMIGLILGGEPPASLAGSVYRRSAGNPLLVEQLACGVKVQGITPRDLMLAAVSRLPDDTQDILRAASAGGQRTSRRLLAAVTGMTPATLAATLRPALAADVLAAEGDSFAFRHSLTGEALHQDLLPCEHTTLHQRFAAALQADSSLVPTGRSAFEQAQHWQHAHDPARSLGSAWLAAAEAGRLLASPEQLAMLTRVLELWSSVPEAAHLTGTDQAHVLRKAAAAARAAGRPDLSIALAAARPTPVPNRPPRTSPTTSPDQDGLHPPVMIDVP